MFFLKKEYNKFLAYRKKRYLKDSDSWFGVEKIDKKKKEEIFNNYYKESFYRFLITTKNLVFAKNPFDFIEKGWGDNWEMGVLVSFLIEEKIIAVSNNEIKIKDNKFFELIPRLKEEIEIKEEIEKKTKKKISEEESVVSFVNNFIDFKIKGEWDQMPISQRSALFSVKKIIDYLPLNKKFLFIGDDDFLSVFLSLADSSIESVVIDADKELLDCIDSIASKLKLKIETRLVDARKKSKLKGDFVGFWCNPPYTEKGVKTFLNYGLEHLNNNGGSVFLVFGLENIGNRLLFLQKYFSQKNLIASELITGKISYPNSFIHSGEDEIAFNRMKEHFSRDKIMESKRLGADLWVFDYVPFKVRKVKTNNSIYSYL